MNQNCISLRIYYCFNDAETIFQFKWAKLISFLQKGRALIREVIKWFSFSFMWKSHAANSQRKVNAVNAVKAGNEKSRSQVSGSQAIHRWGLVEFIAIKLRQVNLNYAPMVLLAVKSSLSFCVQQSKLSDFLIRKVNSTPFVASELDVL